jgi:hypothetical protein
MTQTVMRAMGTERRTLNAVLRGRVIMEEFPDLRFFLGIPVVPYGG